MPRVAIHDDSIPSTKEKQSGGTQGRRRQGAAATNGTSLKDSAHAAANPSAATNGTSEQENSAKISGIKWSKEESEFLHAYRNVYRLETPSSFKNPLSHLLLNEGIGKYSPTYARLRSQRRVSKDHLAKAVRKNFNAMAVNETEVIVNMLYKVKTRDKALRARFAPTRK